MKNNKGIIAPAIAVVILIAVTVALGASYYMGKKSNTESFSENKIDIVASSTPNEAKVEVKDQKTESVEKVLNRDISTDNWNTYTNEQCGYSFKYPNTWVQVGVDTYGVNLKGETTMWNASFVDIKSKDIETHDGKNNQIASRKDILDISCNLLTGAMLYDYNLTEFNKSANIFSQIKKEMIVAGQKAIVGDMSYPDVVSKGEHPGRTMIPYRRIYTFFMHKDNNKSFNFQFETPLGDGDQKEIDTFYKVLDTFKFN